MNQNSDYREYQIDIPADNKNVTLNLKEIPSQEPKISTLQTPKT